MKTLTLVLSCLAMVSIACGNKIAESQMEVWYPKYAKQENIPALNKQLVLTDKEPSLKQKGFVDLYNGKNLDGWVSRGGTCTFEAKGDVIEATTVPGSKSTYLSTTKDDYIDFLFTCEVKWLVPGNTGVQFRSQVKEEKGAEVVFGPQCELEEVTKERGWSGGIYGQSCGGYFYPLWLEAHEEVRGAINYDGWNRITIRTQGPNMKTWINGIPAAHIRNKTYKQGFFSLQSHAGKEGTVQFRNLKVKEFKKK